MIRSPIARCILVVVMAAGLAGCGSESPSPSTGGPSTPASASATTTPGRVTPASEPSPTPSLVGSTVPPLPTGPDALRVALVTGGLSEPIGITNAGDGSGRLFMNERGGRIRIVTRSGGLRSQPFVDLSSRVQAGGERGLLGLAFHPRFRTNRRFFVHYSRAGDGATVVSELRAAPDLGSADPGSERVLLTVAQPYSNHNGGQLAFGPDGYLYIGLGDGGGGGDPLGNAQNRDVLLGKILRIDVDGRVQGRRPYAVPRDNPFAAGGIRPGAGRPEIWAYGLRNPWRFSFDPVFGDLYIGDVGQGRWEEVDRQPADSTGGENYGWDLMEGRHCHVSGCDQARLEKPIAEYSHELGCSITGGEVYRGAADPDLAGVYVFADYCSGIVFTLQIDEGTITPKPVLDSGLAVTAFGTDEDAELYLADLAGGGLYRVRVDD